MVFKSLFSYISKIMNRIVSGNRLLIIKIFLIKYYTNLKRNGRKKRKGKNPRRSTEDPWSKNYPQRRRFYTWFSLSYSRKVSPHLS